MTLDEIMKVKRGGDTVNSHDAPEPEPLAAVLVDRRLPTGSLT